MYVPSHRFTSLLAVHNSYSAPNLLRAIEPGAWIMSTARIVPISYEAELALWSKLIYGYGVNVMPLCRLYSRLWPAQIAWYYHDLNLRKKTDHQAMSLISILLHPSACRLVPWHTQYETRWSVLTSTPITGTYVRSTYGVLSSQAPPAPCGQCGLVNACYVLALLADPFSIDSCTLLQCSGSW